MEVYRYAGRDEVIAGRYSGFTLIWEIPLNEAKDMEDGEFLETIDVLTRAPSEGISAEKE